MGVFVMSLVVDCISVSAFLIPSSGRRDEKKFEDRVEDRSADERGYQQRKESYTSYCFLPDTLPASIESFHRSLPLS
jgi:hypothetical protein